MTILPATAIACGADFRNSHSVRLDLPGSKRGAMSQFKSSPAVEVSVKNQVGWITLNRPESRNPMTVEMQEGIAAALEQLAGDNRIRALVVTARGPAFSAGGDLEVMATLPTLDSETVAAQFAAIYPPFLRLLQFPWPTLAAVNGAAVGGGLGIALLCDIRIAGASASFSAPFGEIGLTPGMGLTYLLPAIIGHARALELLLTSVRWTAVDAHRVGMVSEVVPDEDLMDRATQVAERLVSQAPGVQHSVIQHIRGGLRRGVEEALEREVTKQTLSVQTAEYRNRVARLLEGRNSNPRGGK